MSQKHTFRRTFIAGLFIALPLLVTLWTIQFIFGRVEEALSPVVLETIRFLGFGHWLEIAWLDYLAPLLSVGLGVLVIYLVGLIGGNVLGRQVLKGLERVVLQVPVVRSIYGAVRQFVQTFSQAGGRAFSRVVLVQYPRPGVWTLGFVTNTAAAEIAQVTRPDAVSVFLPTTPNPTSGWLLYVSEAELVTVAMSVDDAFKLIISGGVLSTDKGPDEPFV
jgi:uncharacterized membrane protein